MLSLAATPLAAFLAVTPALASGVGRWSEGDRSSARMVAEAVGPDGTLAAGIEIRLEPGWKTYWMSPGDAGIEPVFDFAASRNADSIEVAFPTPVSYDDGYAISNVYEGGVVFPLTMTVPDPAGPVHLEADIQFGVCKDVCVSDHVVIAVDVEPGAENLRAAHLLREARAALPGAPTAGAFDVDAVWRDGGTDKRPVYVFRTRSPNPESTEVFIAGPDDWYPATPKLESVHGAQATWRVKFSRAGSDVPLTDAAFTVVLVSGGNAVQQEIAPDDSGS